MISLKSKPLTSNVNSTLSHALQSHPDIKRLVVALSGGLDSTVLLHCLASLAPQYSLKLRAIHVHHGLQQEADSWQDYCETLCHRLQVPLQSIKVNATAQAGESPEAAARLARYQALQQHTQTTDLICLAHHQDDQAETLLLQLFRGAGLKGLSAMALFSNKKGRYYLRPLLHCTREAIQHYAVTHQLQWIEDHSNNDQRFDRNYLRHTLMPLLIKRWPGIQHSLARTASHCQQAQLAIENLLQMQFPNLQWADPCLDLKILNNTKDSVKPHIIRLWLQHNDATMPSQQGIHSLMQTVINAKQDASPEVAWDQTVVKRYQQRLYLLHATDFVIPNLTESVWDLSKTCEFIIPSYGKLVATKQLGQGICCKKLLKFLSSTLDSKLPTRMTVEVRFRKPGERFQPTGRRASHPLKKLMQEWNIPPWQRDRIPLLCVEDQCIAVVGYAIAEGWQVNEMNAEEGWQIQKSQD